MISGVLLLQSNSTKHWLNVGSVEVHSVARDLVVGRCSRIYYRALLTCQILLRSILGGYTLCDRGDTTDSVHRGHLLGLLCARIHLLCIC